jgi:hypothetical protein
MPVGYGEVVEVFLDSIRAARIHCDPALIPAPGEYVLAYEGGSDLPLATPIFCAAMLVDSDGTEAHGLLAAPPIPAAWIPGARLQLRGPLGRGFAPPPAARRVALIALDVSMARLTAVLVQASKQDASIVIIGDTPPDDLPLLVEVQPWGALSDVFRWADYVAMDLPRETLPELSKRLDKADRKSFAGEAQALIRTPMPCGGLAECGVCAVENHRLQKLACKDGPVFELKELLD